MLFRSVTTKLTHDGYQYKCKVTDAAGEYVWSQPATLTVKAAVPTIVISDQPDDKTVTAGEKAKFSVSASGEGLTYQWYYKAPEGTGFKQTTFAGNKTATLTVTTKMTHDEYQYKCKITDANGSTLWSEPAILTVHPDSQEVLILGHTLLRTADRKSVV